MTPAGVRACLFALAIATSAWAQDALAPIRHAYQQGPTAERVTLEVPRPDAPPARSVLVVAIRPGPAPAVALQLGEHRPLRILAEPGRLLAWRDDEPTRVYAAVLPEPFGPAAIEAVLPMTPAPQLALALALHGPLLAIAGELDWSPVEGEHRVVGTRANGTGSALTLWHADDGRLQRYELKHAGTLVLSARVEPLAPDEAWFDAPSLEGPNPPTLLDTLADLARPPTPIEPGEPFGQALGIDASGRPNTLREAAGAWEGPLVVLGIDARLADDRANWAGALAEADLPALAEALGVRLVVLVAGADDSASLVERVTWPARGRGEPVRVLAIDAPPAWAGAMSPAFAWRVDGRTWMLQSSHALPDDRVEGDPMGPFESSHAPRSLAERVRMLVGLAGRG